MTEISTFCGSYSLQIGIQVIATFYIVIYSINVFLNIFIMDIVESYKENLKGDLQYDETTLLAFHYICLAYGILTIILAIAVFFKKCNESELFMKFIVKWNVFRCVFIFAGILFVCIAMDEFFTVIMSSMILIVDMCVSTYFTGAMASYVKELEDPLAQTRSVQKHSEIQLVSHKKTTKENEFTPAVDVEVGTSLSRPSEGNDVVIDVGKEEMTNKALESELDQESKRNDGASNVEVAKDTTESNMDPENDSGTTNEQETTKDDPETGQSSATATEREQMISNDATDSGNKFSEEKGIDNAGLDAHGDESKEPDPTSLGYV